MKAASSLLAEAIRDEVRSWRSGPFACRRPAPSGSLHRGPATLEGGGQEVGMDGRHGSAVGQGGVVPSARVSVLVVRPAQRGDGPAQPTMPIGHGGEVGGLG